MARGGKTVDRDLGFRDVRKRIADMKGASVEVGWPAGPEHPVAKMPMPQLAAIHEFGAPAANIPERSTLRAAADVHGSRYRAELREAAGRIVVGSGSVRGELERFGARAAGDVQRAITEFKDPPLGESTVARKGSSQPLIDTGAMRAAVSHRVNARGA